jgi:chemotaxis-related protein WspD
MIDHTDPRSVVAPMPDCWRVIGVGGDRSCPELEQFIHCRNCPVLADAARTFFDRTAPTGYLESWHDILAEPARAADTEATSLLVFRIEKEWLALPTALLVEVAPVRTLHSVPHRAGGGLAGLVNIRGQLQLCMSLHAVLGLPGGPTARVPGDMSTSARLLVVEREGERTQRWVLGVDEVAGVHRVARSAMRPVPSTVSQASVRCSSTLFEWQERTVALIDEGRLLEALAGMVTS